MSDATRRLRALERRLSGLSRHGREIALRDHLAALRFKNCSEEFIESLQTTQLIRRMAGEAK